MISLYRYNKRLYFVTLFLYITLYLGMMAQVLLGAANILSAVDLYSHYSQLEKEHQKHLNAYSVLVGIYFVFFILLFEYLLRDCFIYLTVVPMLLATYFIGILYKIHKSGVLESKCI